MLTLSHILQPWRCFIEYARIVLSFVGYGHASEVFRSALQGGDALFLEGKIVRVDSNSRARWVMKIPVLPQFTLQQKKMPSG